MFSYSQEIILDLIKTGLFLVILTAAGFIFDKTILRGIETIKEIKLGNKAVAIVYAGLFIAIAILLNGRI